MGSATKKNAGTANRKDAQKKGGNAKNQGSNKPTTPKRPPSPPRSSQQQQHRKQSPSQIDMNEWLIINNKRFRNSSICRWDIRLETGQGPVVDLYASNIGYSATYLNSDDGLEFLKQKGDPMLKEFIAAMTAASAKREEQQARMNAEDAQAAKAKEDKSKEAAKSAATFPEGDNNGSNTPSVLATDS